MPIILLYLFVQLVGACYLAWHLNEVGYLPAPFVHDKHDTFMDFFHTLYWACADGMYTNWQSVYPPLVFGLLRLEMLLLGDENCLESGFALRDDGLNYIYLIIAVYLIAPILVMRAKLWSQISISIKTVIYISFVISCPALFSLERGNLVIMAPVFLSMFLSAHSRFQRALGVALALNVKPYMAMLAILPLAAGILSEFIIIVVLSSLLFFLIGAYFEDQLVLFFKNLLGFSSAEGLFSNKEIFSMPSSVAVYSYLFNPAREGYKEILSPEFTSFLFIGVSIYRFALVISSLFVIFFNARFVNVAFLVVLVVSLITNSSIVVGGYSIILYLPLIPVLLQMRFSFQYLLFLAIMFMPLGLIGLQDFDAGIQNVYLGSNNTSVDWSITLGAALNPIINSIFLCFIIYETGFCSIRKGQRIVSVENNRIKTW